MRRYCDEPAQTLDKRSSDLMHRLERSVFNIKQYPIAQSTKHHKGLANEYCDPHTHFLSLYLSKIHYMKKIALLLVFTTAILFKVNAQNKMETEKLLRHVVLFNFKEGSTPAQIKTVTDAFGLLPQKISSIKAFEWGTNNSPENLNQGFTHCFFVSFASEKDRDEYLPHAAHKAFVEVLKPVLDKVLVVDYWNKQ